MKVTTTRRTFVLAGLSCAMMLFMAGDANAISISASASFLGANTADNSDTSPPVAQNLSTVSTLDAGGFAPNVVGATVNAETRYTSVTTADSDAANFASITRNATHSYRVTLTVDVDHPLAQYDIQIDTRRLGALVVRNEGGASGQADISGVTGLFNGGGDAGLNLADLAGLNTNSTTVTQINQSNTATFSGTGDAVFLIDFTWTSSAGSGNNVISGGDEGTVLLGMPGTVSQINAADDYPGTSGRSPQSADGHFTAITVELTVVPEPSTIVLGVFGAGALGLVALRRRKA